MDRDLGDSGVSFTVLDGIARTTNSLHVTRLRANAKTSTRESKGDSMAHVAFASQLCESSMNAFHPRTARRLRACRLCADSALACCSVMQQPPMPAAPRRLRPAAAAWRERSHRPGMWTTIARQGVAACDDPLKWGVGPRRETHACSTDEDSQPSLGVTLGRWVAWPAAVAAPQP